MTIILSLLALVVVCLGVPQIRRPLLSRAVLRFFKRVLPPMSKTEKIALEAGDVWWEGELFKGNPDWNALLNYPKPKLSEAEQTFLDNEVETLCNLLDDWHIMEVAADLPENVWQFLKTNGFFGLEIPTQFGGKGFSALAHSSIVVKIASRSPSTAVTVMVPNSLGPAELLLNYGTDEQKNAYLPRLATGKEIPCFGLTGVEAGSDATSLSDVGIICQRDIEGKQIMGLELTFEKRYITLAPIATLIGLAVKVFDPDHLLSEKVDRGITLCLLSRDVKGLEIGSRHCPNNLAFMNGPIRGEKVFVPLDNIIGGQAMIGQGWHMLMECLSVGRSVSLPALATATSQLSLRMSCVYANLRQQFKLPIARFEGIEEALSEISGKTLLLEATRRFTCGALMQGVRPSLASAIAKSNMTEMGRDVINLAMDIHAGRGIQLGPKNYLVYHYQSAPVMITVEGANILTRNLIIFGQGAMRCHPFVRLEMEVARLPDPKKALRQFDCLLMKHVRYGIKNFTRALFYGLTGGCFIRTPRAGELNIYYKQLTRMSCALATCADWAMLILGGDLKRKERLSARLGDVLSYLYMGSSVLKYAHDEKQLGILPHQWALQMCLFEIQNALFGFFQNFPKRWVAIVLKRVIFPFGRCYQLPNDTLSQGLARRSCDDWDFCQAMSALCFVGDKPEDPTGVMMRTMEMLLSAAPVIQTIKKSVGEKKENRKLSLLEQADMAFQLGQITQTQLLLVKQYEEARLMCLQVDEFPYDYFAKTTQLKESA